jgi:hypothetical protein
MTYSVMAGLCRQSRSLPLAARKSVDGRAEPGHDGMSRDHRDLV